MWKFKTKKFVWNKKKLYLCNSKVQDELFEKDDKVPNADVAQLARARDL